MFVETENYFAKEIGMSHRRLLAGNAECVVPAERIFIDEIEACLGSPLPHVDVIAWDTVGMQVADGHVIGLGVYRSGLTAIPNSISSLMHLRVLNVSCNELWNLPEEIGQLGDLRIIACANNQLSLLPGSVGNLSRLQKIYAGHNHLAGLPDSIGMLAALEQLDLDNNVLTTLPESINGLASLRELNIGSNRNHTNAEPQAYRESPLFAVQWTNGRKPTSPFELQAILGDMSFNQVSCLPNLGGLRSLEKLSAVSNGISELPVSLTTLRYLREVNVSHNNLHSLPVDFGRNQPLHKVDLSWNDLEGIPDALKNCPTLVQLKLEGNRIARAQCPAIGLSTDIAPRADRPSL